MPCTSYRLSRRLLFWRWDADFRGEAMAGGRTLTKGAARRAARNWIRGRQASVAVAAPASAAEPVRLAA